MKTLCEAATLLVAGMFIVGCAGGNSTDPNVVKMTPDMQFEPASITVTAGEKVHWKNESIMFHTVTADPSLAKNAQDVALPAGAQPFNSGLFGLGTTFDHTFTVPGTYRYFCIPHESKGMVGEVIVRPAPHGPGGVKPELGQSQPSP